MNITLNMVLKMCDQVGNIADRGAEGRFSFIIYREIMTSKTLLRDIRVMNLFLMAGMSWGSEDRFSWGFWVGLLGFNISHYYNSTESFLFCISLKIHIF